MAPIGGIFGERRGPTVMYDWLEFLEGNGMVRLYGAIMPSKSEKYEYFETVSDNTENVTQTGWVAQTFTVGTLGTDEDFYVTEVYIDCDTSPSNAILEIQETTSGEPNGTVLARFGNATKLISKANETIEWEGWDLADLETGPAKLSSGTMYALVMYYGGAGSWDAGYHSSGTYTGGAKWDSADSGANWTEDSGADMLFRVYGCSKNPYILTSGSITSSLATSTMKPTDDAAQFTEAGSYSFEGKINKSAIINGDALVNFTLAKGSNVQNYYADVELYHVSGGSETKIGEAKSWIDATATGVEMELTRTKVKAGDTVKLKFILYYVEPTADTNTTLALSHSGSNLKIDLPFKTDL